MIRWMSIFMCIIGGIIAIEQDYNAATTFVLVAILFAIWDFQEKFFTQEKKETK